jgi:dienelactone hydrolase
MKSHHSILLRRALRSKALWQAMALLVGLELLATSAWIAFWFGRSPDHFAFALAALAAPLAAIVGFLCGGRAEQRERWLTRLASICESRRERRRPYYEHLRVGGDPTLSGRLHALKPSRPLATLSSPEQMRAWREAVRPEIISGLCEDAFAPEDNVPSIRVLREIDVGEGVSRAFVTYEASDGTTIPAFLFRPRSDKQMPAAFVVPGHGRGIVETAGLVKSYQHGAALALARVGFITMTPELRGFGHLGKVIGTDPPHVARHALLVGTSYYGVVLHDLRRGLTAFLGHQSVDPTRVAVTGCSLGGDLSITLGALDTRVGAVVAQGLCRWHGERGQAPTPEEDGSEFTGDASDIVPGAGRLAHYEDRFLLLAPRPFAVINTTFDVGNMREEGSWLLRLLRSAYQLERAEDCFQFCVTPGGHEYQVNPAIEFLRRHLSEARRGRSQPALDARTTPAAPRRPGAVAGVGGP